MAKTNKRQRKKNAKTKARKGQLYIPRNRYNRMFEIKSVDIDPHNKYHQELLTSAQFNLFQLNNLLYDRIELEAVDIDTLKWLAGGQFRKIADDIRNLARFDPNYYTNESGGYIMNLISQTISKRFDKVNGVSGTRIVKAINRAYKELKEEIDKHKGKSPNNSNPFVIVYYEDKNK